MTPNQFFVGFSVFGCGAGGYLLGAGGAPAIVVLFFLAIGIIAPMAWEIA